MARRRAIDRAKLLPVGEALLGRIVDGAGRPLDRLGALEGPEEERTREAPEAAHGRCGLRQERAPRPVGRSPRLARTQPEKAAAFAAKVRRRKGQAPEPSAEEPVFTETEARAGL